MTLGAPSTVVLTPPMLSSRSKVQRIWSRPCAIVTDMLAARAISAVKFHVCNIFIIIRVSIMKRLLFACLLSDPHAVREL